MPSRTSDMKSEFVLSLLIGFLIFLGGCDNGRSDFGSFVLDGGVSEDFAVLDFKSTKRFFIDLSRVDGRDGRVEVLWSEELAQGGRPGNNIIIEQMVDKVKFYGRGEDFFIHEFALEEGLTVNPHFKGREGELKQGEVLWSCFLSEPERVPSLEEYPAPNAEILGFEKLFSPTRRYGLVLSVSELGSQKGSVVSD